MDVVHSVFDDAEGTTGEYGGLEGEAAVETRVLGAAGKCDSVAES